MAAATERRPKSALTGQLLVVTAASIVAFAVVFAVLFVRIEAGADPLLSKAPAPRRIIVRRVIEHVKQIVVLPAAAPAPPPASSVTVSGGSSAAGPVTRSS